MKIKHVYGNVLKLDIPLTIKIRTMEGDVPTEREEPFYPDVSKGCVVVLSNNYNRKMEYNASLSGNVAHIEDDGVIGIGTYKVTVKCYDEYGNPYRYMVRDIIEICDATIDAGIEAGVEFNAETYTLEGAVFVSYGGGSFEQVQADWMEADIHSKAYIKNKPTNLVEDESYVHTDNNYTDEEKEKLSELENYDDSGIRQELDGKVDKVNGKGLSTNDYTNEDKSKLDSALQSETDPTVPQWAKQPNKPSYSAQEVGALPSDTPLFSGDYNDLSNKPTIPDAQIQSDWNQSNSSAKDFIKNKPTIPDVTNYVQKSQTAGLLKNDGSVDTNTYLTQHQDISGKQDKIDATHKLSADLVDDTSATNKFVTAADKTTWNGKQEALESGTNIKTINNESVLGSGDISAEKPVVIEAPVNATDATLPITALSCEVGKYYRIDVAVDTLAVTLPAMTDLTTVRTVVIYLTGGTTPAVTISAADSKDVYYQDGFEIEAGSTYEINALFNGAAWIVAAVKINTSNS